MTTSPPRLALVLLQNAWSQRYAGKRWPRRSWLAALARSRTGRRLRVLAAACPGVRLHFDNATPDVGATPDSRLPPDPVHVSSVIASVEPDVVVAMGKLAGDVTLGLACRPPRVLLLPHPAYRLVTNALLHEAGSILSVGFDGVLVLAQQRGAVATKRLH